MNLLEKAKPGEVIPRVGCVPMNLDARLGLILEEGVPVELYEYLIERLTPQLPDAGAVMDGATMERIVRAAQKELLDLANCAYLVRPPGQDTGWVFQRPLKGGEK